MIAATLEISEDGQTFEWKFGDDLPKFTLIAASVQLSAILQRDLLPDKKVVEDSGMLWRTKE